MITRRSLFRGLGAGIALVAAPSIVRAASLMPVKPPRLVMELGRGYWGYQVLNLTPEDVMRAAEYNGTFSIRNDGAAPLTISPGPHEVVVPPGEERSFPMAMPKPHKEWRMVTLGEPTTWSV